MISSAPTVSELAKSITDRPYLSWSQCQSYQFCPQKFCFQYVEQIEPEFTPSTLCFGSAIHSAISLHHEAQLEGIATPQVDKLLNLVRDDLEPTTAPIRYNKNEDQDMLLELAERMLLAFFKSDHAVAQGKLLCIEEGVSGSVDQELPDITGYIDLVTITDAGLIVTDYKTTRSAWSAAKAEENAAQLRLYGELLKMRFDDELAIAKLQFVTITKAKSPKVVAHTVASSDEKLKATVDQIREVWKGIEAGVFPTRPGWICKQCQFQSKCDSAAI